MGVFCAGFLVVFLFCVYVVERKEMKKWERVSWGFW